MLIVTELFNIPANDFDAKKVGCCNRTRCKQDTVYSIYQHRFGWLLLCIQTELKWYWYRDQDQYYIKLSTLAVEMGQWTNEITPDPLSLLYLLQSRTI